MNLTLDNSEYFNGTCIFRDFATGSDEAIERPLSHHIPLYTQLNACYVVGIQ